jgi:hypothetical protein
MAMHFGLEIRKNKYGFKLNRSNYAAGSRKCSFPWQYGAEYAEEELAEYIKDCMENYDLNMKYFAGLGLLGFDNAIKRFLHFHPEFVPVADLNAYNDRPGYYMMVLGKYRQIYLGTTHDIKRRIQKHWKTVKPLDRLISGYVETSIISIDSFRALDTTRIFVYVTPRIFGSEDAYLAQLPDKYLCNRTVGGRMKGGKGTAVGLGESLGLRKTRNLKCVKISHKKGEKS